MNTDLAIPKVLVIDDDRNTLALVGKILMQEDFEVFAATTVDRAREILAAVAVDLVLLDLVMPESDGYSVCRDLKANPRTRSIPVIFLTGRAEEEAVLEGFEAGGVDLSLIHI